MWHFFRHGELFLGRDDGDGKRFCALLFCLHFEELWDRARRAGGPVTGESQGLGDLATWLWIISVAALSLSFLSRHQYILFPTRCGRSVRISFP